MRNLKNCLIIPEFSINFLSETGRQNVKNSLGPGFADRLAGRAGPKIFGPFASLIGWEKYKKI